MNLKKQNVINVKRITISKLNKIIDMNTYTHTFNNPKPPPQIKIGYTLAKVEKYIPNHRTCLNCQKYRHLKEACSRKPVRVKCGVHEQDPTEDTCTNNLNCSNCNESHGTDSKHCKIWKKETRRLVEMPYVKPTFAKITKTPLNENQVNTQIKKKRKYRIAKPN